MTKYELYRSFGLHDGESWYENDRSFVATVEIDIVHSDDYAIIGVVNEAIGMLLTGAEVDDHSDGSVIGINDAETGEPWYTLIQSEP